MLNETGPVEDCQIEGTLPMFGNNDKGVDRTARSAADAVAPPITANVACGMAHVVQPARAGQLDAVHREVRGA